MKRSVRALALSLAAGALTLGAAQAAPVLVKPLVLSEDAAETFKDKYGEREIKELQDYLTASLTKELAKSGGQIAADAPITIAPVLEDAKPNRPTFKQLSDQPSLDFLGSVSIGGAELSAKITDAQGRVLQDVGYRWYESDIRNATGNTTWTDARRAIRRFAAEVGEAYGESTTPQAEPKS